MLFKHNINWKYAFGEVILIFIGITLAIAFDNWNEKRILKKEELSFYQNFKRQILEDKGVIDGTNEYNKNYMVQYSEAIQIIEADDRSRMDTLGFIALKMTKYSDFDRPSDVYQSIVNSGQLKLISNHDITEKIQQLEETYVYFNRLEDIHYDLVMTVVPELINVIKFTNRQVIDPAALYHVRFQNILSTAVTLMSEKEEVYLRALNQIETIVQLIDKEMTMIQE